MGGGSAKRINASCFEDRKHIESKTRGTEKKKKVGLPNQTGKVFPGGTRSRVPNAIDWVRS